MAFTLDRYRPLTPEIVYHQGRYYGKYQYNRDRDIRRTLPKPYGVDGLNGWFKSLTKAVKKIVKPIAKIITAPVRASIALVKGDFKGAAGIVVAPWAGSEATRGRILRRAGGVITGAATGFFTGGPIGAIIGGATGGIMAKKGVKGIKGYGKIGLVSAVTGGAGGAVVGAAAQTGFSAGLLSQSTAQSLILSSGQAGMIGTGIAAGAPLPIIGGIGVKSVIGAVSTAKGIFGMLAPKSTAPTEVLEESAIPSYAGESYMDIIRNTSGVNPNTSSLYSQSRGSSQTYGGGEGQYIPTPTGADFPGQDEGTQLEYEQEPQYDNQVVKRELLPGLNTNMLLAIGGIGILAMIAYKK